MKNIILILVMCCSSILSAATLEELQEYKERQNPVKFFQTWGYEGWLRDFFQPVIAQFTQRRMRLDSGLDIMANTGFYVHNNKQEIIVMKKESKAYGKNMTLDFTSIAPLVKLALYTGKDVQFNQYIVSNVEPHHNYDQHSFWNYLGGESQNFPRHIVIRPISPENTGNTYAVFEKLLAPDQYDCGAERLLALFSLNKVEY